MDKPDYSIGRYGGHGILVVMMICFVAFIAAVVL